MNRQRVYFLGGKGVCTKCGSDRAAKNGHRHDKQWYICKDCGKQFAQEYSIRGYPPQIKQQCLALHQQGTSFREIERQTGVSHNTVINWVRQSSIDLSKIEPA